MNAVLRNNLLVLSYRAYQRGGPRVGSRFNIVLVITLVDSLYGITPERCALVFIPRCKELKKELWGRDVDEIPRLHRYLQFL